MMGSTALRPIVLLCCALLWAGADGCPLTMNVGDNGASPGGTSEQDGLDLGGPNGAVWKLSYDDETLVTLRHGGAVAAKLVGSTDGPVSLAGNTLELASFCWRTDVVCPRQVLTSQTVVAQPQGAFSTLYLGFNPRGPLAALAKQQNVLEGRLDQHDLTVPLGLAQKSDPCTLWNGSAILATAYVEAETEAEAGTDGEDVEIPRAATMKGKVTVVYSGTCLNLSGNAVYPEAAVELSADFSASRE